MHFFFYNYAWIIFAKIDCDPSRTVKLKMGNEFIENGEPSTSNECLIFLHVKLNMTHFQIFKHLLGQNKIL